MFQSLLEKLAVKLKSLSGLERFHSGLIMIEAVVTSSLFSNVNTKHLTDDMTSTLEMITTFYIPITDFEKCVAMIKSLDNKYKSVADVLTFDSLIWFCRTQCLQPILLTLCNVAIQKLQHEWMGLLPLLHVMKHDSFVPKKPFALPSVKKDIFPTLFCGLDVQKLLSELPVAQCNR